MSFKASDTTAFEKDFIQSCVKQIDSTIIRVVLKMKVFNMTKVECKKVLYASLFIRT